MTSGKRYRTGTHRMVEPAATLERVRPLLPAMGITRVANVTGLDRIGVPVVMVCRPNSRSLAVHQGKGLDLAAAKASGVMEAIECYHAEHMVQAVMLAGHAELCRAGYCLADVGRLPRVADSLFNEHFRLLWVEGTDLLRQRSTTWVPHEMVHADYRMPMPQGSGCFMATTNGLASGNSPMEAIAHGLAELIERDARALWSMRGEAEQRASALDLASVDDPECRDVIGLFERAGLSVTVWNATSDIPMPCFLCRIGEPGGLPGGFDGGFYGAGAHPTRGIALLRALTEAAQSRLTKIAGSRDDMAPDHYEDHPAVEAAAFANMAPAAGQAGHRFGDIPTFDGASFEEDVGWMLSRLEAAGIEQAVMVDLSKPEFGIPVVRMVVPGLEGMHTKAGWTPGRRAAAILKGAER
jgi:YcaO-like protein with predicted kinase domain